MRAGLTRQALKANPYAYVGPFITQALAAALVVASLGAQRTLPPAGDVADMGAAFLLISIYLSILIVGVTMGASIGRQAADIALARTIGASPGQVRRSVVAQAMLVAIPATLVGAPLGSLAGRAWIHGLAAHGVIPADTGYHGHPAAAAIAFAITIGTSVPGTLIAAVRPSRVRPAVALSEAAAPRRTVGHVRTVIGLVLVAAGGVLSVLVSRLDARDAENEGFFVALTMCVGAGFLAPALLRAVSPVVRLAGPVGRLAAEHLAVRARTYSGAMVPLTLAAAFSAIQVLLQTTPAHLSGVRPTAEEVWTDYTGTAVYAVFAAVAALNTLINTTVARRRDLAVTRLAGGTQGRVLGIVFCEALVVTGTSLVVAAVVAMTTVSPILHAAWMPGSYLVAGVLLTAALVLAGTVVPAAAGMRRPAVELVG
ncbi:FtsX-like permease family protein [Actinoplanes sp. NPDC051411]|uniref:FtsX-like permease family protein n=1 Tax=Actinoplanes sp. NPDC051411 TaxID=3155522 RepID=UPI00341889F0